MFVISVAYGQRRKAGSGLKPSKPQTKTDKNEWQKEEGSFPKSQPVSCCISSTFSSTRSPPNTSSCCKTTAISYARVAELVDALDLGSSLARGGGSSPLSRTTFYLIPKMARSLFNSRTRLSECRRCRVCCSVGPSLGRKWSKRNSRVAWFTPTMLSAPPRSRETR